MDEARATEAVWWGESELQGESEQQGCREREQQGSVWRQQTSNTSKTRGEGTTLTRARALDPIASEDEEDEEGSGAEERGWSRSRSGTHQQAECQGHSQALLHTRERARQTRPRQHNSRPPSPPASVLNSISSEPLASPAAFTASECEGRGNRVDQLQGTASSCIVHTFA